MYNDRYKHRRDRRVEKLVSVRRTRRTVNRLVQQGEWDAIPPDSERDRPQTRSNDSLYHYNDRGVWWAQDVEGLKELMTSCISEN